MKANALFFLLLAAVPLTAADPEDRGPLNDDTPSWLTLHGAARFRAEDHQGVDYQHDNERGFLLQRYRFSAGLRLTSWMTAFGEMQDARGAGGPHPNGNLKDSLDLRQAWLRLGTEKSFWDLTAGRQILAFGGLRVIGAAEWGNTARVFDAVKLGLHHGVDRVDVFSSAVVQSQTDAWDHHQDGDNLHGAYGSIRSLAPKAVLEPYALYRTSASFPGLGVASGPYHSSTFGFRAASAGLDKWGYEAEILGQRGGVGSRRLSAWALTLIGRRSWSSVRWKPEALAEYSFASGDRNQGDNRVNTLDQIYPTNHVAYGITDIIGRRNLKDARAGIALHPVERLTVRAEGHSLWLASRFDGLYPGGAASIPAVPGGAVSTDVGRELDIMGDLRVTKHYDVGLQVGHLFPGAFIKTYSPGASRTFYALFVDLHI